MTVYVNRCRSCFAPIRWARTAAGRMAPISLATGENHFIDCPERRQWRKESPAATPAGEQRPLWDDRPVEQ